MKFRNFNPADVKDDMEEYSCFLKDKSEAAFKLVEALKREFNNRNRDETRESTPDSQSNNENRIKKQSERAVFLNASTR